MYDDKILRGLAVASERDAVRIPGRVGRAVPIYHVGACFISTAAIRYTPSDVALLDPSA